MVLATAGLRRLAADPVVVLSESTPAPSCRRCSIVDVAEKHGDSAELEERDAIIRVVVVVVHPQTAILVPAVAVEMLLASQDGRPPAAAMMGHAAMVVVMQ